MLKAIYEFVAVYPKTIRLHALSLSMCVPTYLSLFFSFDEGEMFILHQTSARQRNWWQVVNERGNIGFVPSNYVEKLKVSKKFRPVGKIKINNLPITQRVLLLA